MLIIQSGFCGFGVRKGKLLGTYEQHPLTIVSLLLFKVTITNKRSSSFFAQALEGLIKDRDWHIKNAASIRAESKRQKARLRKQYESEYKSLSDSYRDRMHEEQHKNQVLSEENRNLKKSLEIMLQYRKQSEVKDETDLLSKER